MFDNIINIIFGLIGVVIFAGVFCRVLIDRFSGEKIVEAIVVEKQKYTDRVMSKAKAPYDRERYVIIFMAENKKLSFYVSEFSYKTYRKNQKGMLTYKGSKIIDFK